MWEIWPSVNASPACTNSPSCTKICLDFSTKYSTLLPVPSEIIILSLFLKGFPNVTTPSNEANMVIFFGLLASNNSETLGRPPVISLDFFELLLVFYQLYICNLNSFPSVTFKEVLGSKEYLIISLSSVAKITVGLYIHLEYTH